MFTQIEIALAAKQHHGKTAAFVLCDELDSSPLFCF